VEESFKKQEEKQRMKMNEWSLAMVSPTADDRRRPD
jgi:hypothetical protein